MLPRSAVVLISQRVQRVSSAVIAPISCGATRLESGGAGVAIARTVGTSGSVGTCERDRAAPRVTCR